MFGMDAPVSYGFHTERKLHPEKFKNQAANQVVMKSRSMTLWLSNCRKKSSVIFELGMFGSSCLISEGSSCLSWGSSSLVSSPRSMVSRSRSRELRISSTLCVYTCIMYYYSI